MTNVEKINELYSLNESLVSLTENIADLTEENSKRIIVKEKWLMALTDLVNPCMNTKRWSIQAKIKSAEST